MRVDCAAAPENYRLNEEVLAGYIEQLKSASVRLHLHQFIHAEQFFALPGLLALPGVVDARDALRRDLDAIWPLAERTIQHALTGLSRMRQDEGKAMAADLAQNCQLISGELAAVERLAPRVVEGYRQRLTEKLNKLLEEFRVSVNTTDIVREVGLFAERSDISEEIVRLRSHVEQFLTIMGAADSNGRKLEFLTQEMFREANTIGSKSNDAQIAQHVIEIKTAIERVREMIQNVE
jgi:uncharacterized protein (TIGR00255 family)